MASRKKQSEGIALLSLYNDEDDEDMEDLDDQQQQEHQQKGEEELPAEHRESNEGQSYEELKAANGAGHEKTPTRAVQVLTPNVNTTSPSSEHLETSQLDKTNNTDVKSEAAENESTPNVPAENDDPLDKFLPPPPKEKCPEELQRKIDKFISLKKVGRSFNAEVRNRKDYRNPDFLQHAVRYQEVDEIGSCFSKDVFDPHGYDLSDFYIDIEADMRREKERKEQELKKSPKVEFFSGGTHPGQVLPLTKFSLPIPVPSAASSTAPDAVTRDGRQNEKSKWDKVDGDGRNYLPASGQDSLATAAAHAAILSAVNVGAGYSAFVQQKRREAEERRSSEKKLE